jgi:hypothetical protein
MNVLITITWRAGANHTENRAAAQVVQERLMNPFPGVTIIHTLADLGKRKLYVIADVTEHAVNDVRTTLELTAQPAIESVDIALVVDGKKAINTYLAM